MDTLEQVVLTNAVMATALALLASAVGLVCRRPALIHSLWLLVLVKLITPPICQIEIFQLPATSQETLADRLILPAHDMAKDEDADSVECCREGRGQLEKDEKLIVAREELAPAEPQGPTLPDSSTVASLGDWSAWRPLLWAVWISGSLGCFLIAGIRVIRFQWLL